MRHRIRSHIAMGASAETYNLLHPVPAIRAEVMMTADTGCWTQVATTLARIGKGMPLAHTVQELNATPPATSRVRKLLERARDGPGAVVTRAIPQTTTLPTRGAAPSSPVS